MGTPQERESRIDELHKGGSIINFALAEAKSLERGLPAQDKKCLR